MRVTIKDIDRVDRILKDPDIYSRIIDDGSPSVGEYSSKELLGCDLIYVLMPNDTSVFIAYPFNSTTYIYHPRLLKEGRGEVGDKACHEVIEYMFTQTPAEKLLAFIPVCFPTVKRHSERFGFKQEGLITKAIKRDGVFYDQYVVALNK